MAAVAVEFLEFEWGAGCVAFTCKTDYGQMQQKAVVAEIGLVEERLVVRKMKMKPFGVRMS